MEEEKKFICVCKKEFKSQKSLSAHQTSCKDYYMLKYGNLDKWEQRLQRIGYNSKLYHSSMKYITYLQNNYASSNDKKQQELDQWISEQHRCEKCGKVMTEYFGSGRFCSRSCANSKTRSNESKQKTQDAMRLYGNQVRNVNEYIYYQSPKKCLICGNIIEYVDRKRKTCSKDCYLKMLSNISIQRDLGGYVQFSGGNKSSKGYYKGIYCDSTWELAYIVYNQYHGIEIKRCEQTVEYKYKDKVYTYYPDFIINGKLVVEIKGYCTDKQKLEQKIIAAKKFFGEDNYIVLYKEDMLPIIKFVKKICQVQSLKLLYDR